MKRYKLLFLKQWLLSKERKPLIIRGARQVGKTWIVRELAKQTNRVLIELNFEQLPQLQTLFISNNPSEILINLEAHLNQTIDPNNTLLFLDEIQAAPSIFSKLRWFAEQLPELPVIAAGSLLEFVLENPSFSMPVGRINYMYLEPFSFEEFLLAKKKEQLQNYIKNYNIKSEIPPLIHQQLTELFKEYIIIGGMPAVIKSWIEEQSLTKVNQISYDLLATYRDDFGKYKGRLALEKLDEVLASIPLQLGQKFICSRVNKEATTASIKHALKLLNRALVAHQVTSTAANGLPLGAEVNEKNFKEIFIDVGLCSTTLGLSLSQVKAVESITLINKGGIAEQVVGQLLRTIEQPFIEPKLFYWQREKKGSEAEIDYIMQHSNLIVPIEVKAGTTGTLKSLHLFMDYKKLPLAVRINSDLPSITNVGISKYRLISLPFYLLGEIHRLLDENLVM